MKKLLILLVLCFLPLAAALSAPHEADVSSYFSNKVLVDEKLSKLKTQEDEQKKKIDVLNAEIDALKRRLAIFGEPDEHEPEKSLGNVKNWRKLFRITARKCLTICLS